MRFVSPETVRIDLAKGDWIEVRKELTVGEDLRMSARGYKRIGKRDGGNDMEIDWVELAFARVEAYLVDWSAKTEKGKSLDVSPDAIRSLASEDFKVIDEAIQAHMVTMADEKKERAGMSDSAAPSQS